MADATESAILQKCNVSDRSHLLMNSQFLTPSHMKTKTDVIRDVIFRLRISGYFVYDIQLRIQPIKSLRAFDDVAPEIPTDEA